MPYLTAEESGHAVILQVKRAGMPYFTAEESGHAVFYS